MTTLHHYPGLRAPNQARVKPGASLRTRLLALIALGTLASLTGCATSPTQAVAAPAPAPAAKVATAAAGEETVVCRREIPTGMRIATTVCRRLKDMETRAKEDREAMERIPAELPSER